MRPDVDAGAVWMMNGDCLERMSDIPSASIDLILSDPPYGNTRNKWDSIIHLESMWTQLKRVIKSNGAIIMTAMQPFTTVLIASNMGQFRYDWVWQKPKGTGHLNANRMPMRDKEDVLVFYGALPTYNPQMSVGAPYRDKSGAAQHSGYGADTRLASDNAGTRHPKQVIQFDVVGRGGVHPTQKPVALMEYMIKTYTDPGETVLDFAMGSGTTGVAALSAGRNFVGIELDAGYYESAAARVAEVVGGPPDGDVRQAGA